MMARLVKMVMMVVLDQMLVLKTLRLQFLNNAHAKNVLESLVLVDHLDNQVNLEMLEVLETMVLLVGLDKLEMLVEQVHLVAQDQKDLQEPLDSKQMEEPDQLELLVHLAHKVPLDQMDNLDNLVLALKDLLAHKVHLDLLVSLEAMVDLVPLDHLEKLAALALATTVRHLGWPPDIKWRCDAGHGFDTALLLCSIFSFFKVTL